MKFYHLSHTWSEERLLISPRVNSRPDTKEEWEYIPCICVSPTVVEAIIALGDYHYLNRYKIYSCDTEHAVPEKRVFDFEHTREHRLFVPTEFKLEGDFKSVDVSFLEKLSKKYPAWGPKSSVRNMKIVKDNLSKMIVDNLFEILYK